MFDPTVKDLVELEPQRWPRLLGQPAAPTEVIDADIGTVSGAADKVLRVAARPPYLLHLEFVAGHDAVTLPRKLHAHNGLLELRHDLPVRSVIVLLHPESDSPQLTGVYTESLLNKNGQEEPYLVFRYQVLRVWQEPPQHFLHGGLSLLPLALLSNVTEAQLPGLVAQMQQRLDSRRGRRLASKIWGAAYILAGLRYPDQVVASLFQGVLSMQESSTYQAMLRESKKQAMKEAREEVLNEAREEASTTTRQVLRVLAERILGPADAPSVAALEAITDLAQLQALSVRVPTVSSWQELLAPPATGRPSKKRRSS